jgi:hypothetical protein
MRHRIAVAPVLLGLAFVALAPAALAAQAAAPRAEETTITGQVVDVSCLILNNATGASHKACAQACADKGIPLGVKTADGTIYIPLGTGMANAQNPKLREFAEGNVRVTGVHRFTNGVHTIEVKSVAAAT